MQDRDATLDAATSLIHLIFSSTHVWPNPLVIIILSSCAMSGVRPDVWKQNMFVHPEQNVTALMMLLAFSCLYFFFVARGSTVRLCNNVLGNTQ